MIINRFFKNYSHDKFIALALRVLGIPLAFFLSVYLSRSLDIKSYGSYLAIFQLFTFVVKISLLGIGPIIIKKAALLYYEKKTDQLNKFLLESILPTLSFFLLVCLFLLIFKQKLLLFYEIAEKNIGLLFFYFILGFCFQLLIFVLNQFFISFKKIWQTNLTERFLLNGLFILFLVITSSYKFDLEIVAFSFFLSRSIALIISFFLIKNSFSPYKFIRPRIKNIKKLIYDSWPVCVSGSSIQLYNIIPLQLIVLIENTESAALFGVAFLLSTLTSFLITLSYTFVSADIAKAYSEFDLKKIKKINFNSSILLSLISIFFFFIFVLIGRLLLTLWGADYESAYFTLLILSFGQIINSYGGVSEMILNICGMQKNVFMISLKCLVLSLIFCVILTYMFGYIGTAIGYVLTISCYNLMKLKSVNNFTNAIS